MRQRLLLHDGDGSRGLGRVGFHEFHARRRVIKQLAHEDGRPARAACRFLGEDLPGLEMQADAVFRVLRAGQKVDLRDRGDGGQRFAAEAQRADAGKILLFADLARRVAQEGCARVVRRHAAAVVGDAQEGHAAVL